MRETQRREQGRLVATDPILNRILREAVIASILGDGATRSESIALPFIAHDGERFVGHLLPLTSGRRRKTGVAYDATAVLFVNKASLDSSAATMRLVAALIVPLPLAIAVRRLTSWAA